MSPMSDTRAGRGSVLVVDDEPEVLAAMHRQLRREFEVFTAEDADRGYAILRAHPIQVIVSDQRMPHITGAEFLARAKDEFPDAVRLLLTGYADLHAVIQAINVGQIFRYITKPWDPVEIRTVVREAYQRSILALENAHLLAALLKANAELEQRVEARTRELSESEGRYRSIVDGTSDPVMLVDAAQWITAINPAFTRVTGYGVDDAIGHTPAILSSGRHPPAFYEAMRKTLRETGEWHGPVWNRRKDGSAYIQLLKINCIRDPTGQPKHYVAVYTDLGEDFEQLDQFWASAQHDPLTGLPNRTLLMDRLRTAVLEAERYGHKFAVLFADLDRFKPINDQHGHAAGDELLQALARRLTDSIRDSDTLARVGGDEFVLLLRHVPDRDSAAVLADHLAEVVARPFTTARGELSVGLSIGVAMYPEDGTDVAALLERADAAMYAKKFARKDSTQGAR
jgi:diguanylate cyclase (GGDEF)-like protein/PAS domain S-box-containing protein